MWSLPYGMVSTIVQWYWRWAIIFLTFISHASSLNCKHICLSKNTFIIRLKKCIEHIFLNSTFLLFLLHRNPMWWENPNLYSQEYKWVTWWRSPKYFGKISRSRAANHSGTEWATHDVIACSLWKQTSQAYSWHSGKQVLTIKRNTLPIFCLLFVIHQFYDMNEVCIFFLL